ncbi:hypothetical protein [Solibacillus sp. FSL H8-0538]|uniref:hypothetical protein n=1 Tax=Solibacillus sp. FSL H8-0538 TaxID=2921400 RepID=UPI0030FBC902
MVNLYTVIDQYQRGYTNVLNRLIVFRKEQISFNNSDLNHLYRQFTSTNPSNNASDFLQFLQSNFSSLSLSQYRTHQQIVSYLKEEIEKSA